MDKLFYEASIADTAESYFTINTTISYKHILNTHFYVSLTILNLLNENYERQDIYHNPSGTVMDDLERPGTQWYLQFGGKY